MNGGQTCQGVGLASLAASENGLAGWSGGWRPPLPWHLLLVLFVLQHDIQDWAVVILCLICTKKHKGAKNLGGRFSTCANALQPNREELSQAQVVL